ncbi:MAG: LysM peptidoglycan-binding domain-containing protein [Planctomycetota bacterium]
MKRNETILVYSVTGLLVVILAVAILFGNERGAEARAQPGGQSLDDLTGIGIAGVASASDSDGEPVDAGEQPDAATANAGPQPGPAATAPTGAEAAPVRAELQPVADASAAQAPERLDVPLAMGTPKQEPATPVDDPAMRALVLLGDSKREGDYRLVTVRHNDTFSELVQRWCGDLVQLEVAESLNEEVNLARLEPGSRVCLPWVDDAVLIAAHEARKTKQEEAMRVVAEARNKGQDYVVKPGDSLWSIAVRHVGAKGASKFIDQAKALNADLMANPDRLPVGKTIILPK